MFSYLSQFEVSDSCTILYQCFHFHVIVIVWVSHLGEWCIKGPWGPWNQYVLFEPVFLSVEPPRRPIEDVEIIVAFRCLANVLFWREGNRVSKELQIRASIIAFDTAICVYGSCGEWQDAAGLLHESVAQGQTGVCSTEWQNWSDKTKELCSWKLACQGQTYSLSFMAHVEHAEDSEWTPSDWDV